MKKTYVDVILELPVDATLQAFLTGHGLPVPVGFAWEDSPETSQALVEAVQAWPDTAARDAMTANLMASVQLGDPAGKQAMFEAVVSDAAALAGLALCCSDIHRSFWLYIHHRSLFERAVEFNHWAQRCAQSQLFDLGIRRTPDMSDAALIALRQAISAFYKQELQCGDSSIAYLVERSPGVFLLTVHVKDSAMLRLEFEGAILRRRVGNPNIHMVLEYAQATGVVRTLVRGGQKYQMMLVEAFAEHVLGVKTSGQRIRPPTLDLSMLRTGFDVPKAFEDGFVALQVKALTLLSDDASLKMECTAMLAAQQRSVHELLAEKMPEVLASQSTVTAAKINLYYPPEPGRTRAKVISIEVTSRGRLNLHKFDPSLQAQLERYLVSVGVLQRGQTLSVHRIPPEADMVDTDVSPVVEG
jgi:hypothetical protein